MARLCVLVFMISLTSQSAVVCGAVVFNFLGQQGTDVDGVASGQTTVGGITAFLSTNSGVLNKGTTNFGIDSAGTDETTRIDHDNVDEVLTISFSQSVFLNSFTTSGGNSATVGGYTAGLSSGAFTQLSSGDAVTTSFVDPGILISLGQTFTIQQNSGATGFSFDSMTVTAVPEPSSIAALGILGVMALMIRRRRVNCLKSCALN